ncbi:MAG: hypothetical protein ACREMY_01270 [bacterium]
MAALPQAAEVVERAQRRRLMRDPQIWGIELARLFFYVCARIIAIPWLLVWPAVIFWILWVAAGFDVTEVGYALQTRLGAPIAWTYVIGATLHSLTSIGWRPYQSEVERRLEAYMLRWYASRAWLERNAHPSDRRAWRAQG